MRPHGRAYVRRMDPRAQAVCDRCGFRYNHDMLVWQFDWRGPIKQNLRILVCQSCLDKPQEQLKTIVLPPDPLPIDNPRPEIFSADNNPLSGIGFDPMVNQSWNVVLPSSTIAFIGTIIGGAGISAPFYGSPTKKTNQSAYIGLSSTGANWVGVNWSALPFGANTTFAANSLTFPSSVIAATPNSFQVFSFAAYAPFDQPFLTSSGCVFNFDGSNDGVTWTNLATGTTAGLVGEALIVNSTVDSSLPNANVITVATSLFNQSAWGFHRFSLIGDGMNPLQIAYVAFNAAGQSFSTTGSELGA